MYNLLEILHSIAEEKKKGHVPIDDWKLSEAEYLFEMGFKATDEYNFTLDGKPRIIIFKKKQKDDITGEVSEYYFLDDRTNVDVHGNAIDNKKNVTNEDDSVDDNLPKVTKIKRFKTFEEIEKYFNQYSQPDLEKNL